MPRPKKGGPRRRFNGFALTDEERDRVVAEWINRQPNAAESIKALIYAAATGAAIATAAPIAVNSSDADETLPEIDPTDPRVQALAALDT